MKELFIRRQVDESFREQVAQLNETEKYSLEISRLCFESTPWEEVTALMQTKHTCISLTIASCRHLGSFFIECGQLPQPFVVDTLTLVNPTQDGIDALSSELFHKTITIRSLNINSSITPGLAVSIVQAIDSTDIESLDLSHCHLDRRAVSTLADGFSRATSLQCLNLSHCHLEDSLLAEILYSLQNHPSLHDLRISFNNCHSEACTAIGALLGGVTRLERLEMAQQFIGRQKCLDINSIVIAMSCNSSLRYLDLKENFLDAQHVETLLSALSENKTLEELDLSCTDICDKCLPMLASKLNTTNIRKLSLCHNPFQNAEPLVDVVKHNYGLHQVNVDSSVTARATLYYYAALNRAGRTLLVDTKVPLSLWPLILEKAGSTNFPEDLDIQAFDIVHYLIQGPAVL